MFKNSATFWIYHPWPTCVVFETIRSGQVWNNIHNYCIIKGKTMFHVWRMFTEITSFFFFLFPPSPSSIFFFFVCVSSLIPAWINSGISSVLGSNTADCVLWLLNENTFVHHVEVSWLLVCGACLSYSSVCGFFCLFDFPCGPNSPSFPHAFTSPCILKQLELHVIMTVGLHLPKCTCKVRMSSQFRVDKALLYWE